MSFTAAFPLLEDCTYLNTASSGLLSTSILAWRKLHDEDFFHGGSNFRLQQREFLQDVREHVARFFHSKVDNTFLVQNLSIGFNTFLDGLSADHKFLLVASDYPSVNYPVESRGFSCDYALADAQLEQNILAKMAEFKPTILALSLVQYTNGIKIDLNFLKRLKESYPNLLIVGDGTQFCGTSAFNFETSGLDVLISSGYKWMLSGYGNGFVLLKDQVSQHLYQERISYPLPTESFLKDRSFLSLCFEPGHLDTLSFGTLKQSILLLESVGNDFIAERLQLIGGMAKKALTERGLLTPSVVGREAHSTIFNIPTSAELFKKLQAANIIVTPRGDGLRLSFHFFNTEADLQKLLQVLDQD
ncbi:aminotransferase class V-fold PLP-dependent enzyme [Pedobacter gandavensis]|uniref:Aminotransferase class V-fold PLP-dependent enzyme n=1 Tax=Pedobacter gandavensis TaxID=2679963 RepID=A0ABR6ERW2_9SPHI|nr:aminotransferase class V-fold PLP-dependent enzyme [Pedobacter gandavensis]MBB2147992.1 aminotransferase class V-fold PLP-dependent enzyme [Pedobacter gandavensis]